MAGDFLLKLKDQNIFRPTVMDTIVNEFEPDPDQFMFTEAFLPFKEVDSLDVIDMVQFGAYGRTYPVRLGADHMRIDLPGQAYKQYGSAHWREGMIFNEEVLLRAINPAAPLERIGEGLVTKGLDLLDLRINNLIELISMDTVLRGFYQEDRWDVNYTFNPNIAGFRYIDITSSSGSHRVRWTTSGSWDVPATADPLADIKGAVQFFRKLGYETSRIWMNDLTAAKAEACTSFQTQIARAPQLVVANIENEAVFQVLTGLKGQSIKIDSRVYHEETRIRIASGASDTILYVEDSAPFHLGDDLLITTSAGVQYIVQQLTSEPNANAITIPAAISAALAVGDRIVALKKRMKTNYIILEGQKSSRTSNNNWISTPSLVKNSSIGNPLPGRYTWSHFQTDRPPFNMEIGAGISGGPKIGEANWMVVKVSDTDDDITWL